MTIARPQWRRTKVGGLMSGLSLAAASATVTAVALLALLLLMQCQQGCTPCRGQAAAKHVLTTWHRASADGAARDYSP
jgi:hypothetical protein